MPEYTITVDELLLKLQELQEQNHGGSKIYFSGDEKYTEHRVNDMSVDNQNGIIWLIGQRT